MTDKGYRDKEIDTATVREVVGVVQSSEQLETLAIAFAKAGFDRADIDLMASRKTIDGLYGQMPELDKAVDYQRRELVTGDDKETATVLTFGTLIALGSLGAALPVVASGGAIAAALGSALAGGAVGTGIGALVRDRLIGSADADRIERELKSGGIVVFVRVRDQESEQRAADIMRSCDVTDVHAHDVELKKTLHDIPLANIVPDPWLGRERLGG